MKVAIGYTGYGVSGGERLEGRRDGLEGSRVGRLSC